MIVSVVYALPDKHIWLHLDVEEGSTMASVIEQSGILQKCPDIDLSVQKVGVFGKICKPDTPLKEGDRVEIYRKITADPKTVKRRQTADE